MFIFAFLYYFVVAIGKQQTKQKSAKYIVLPNVHEGYSEWRQVISKMFVIASFSNHIIVEPCIINSTLIPCFIQGAIPMFEIFRKDLLMAQFPAVSIVSWAEYESANRISNISTVLCVRSNNNFYSKVKDYSSPLYKQMVEIFNIKKIENSQPTMQDCVNQYFTETIILYKPWRHFMTIEDQTNPTSFIDFLPKYYELANNILTTAGINISNYVVIHWRSETAVNKEHIDCVRMLLNYASNWTKHLNSRSKPILVSDLSLRPNVKLWNTMRLHEQNLLTTSEKSLIRKEMLKIEVSLVFQRFKSSNAWYKDIMFDTVIDTIISYNARMFVACMTVNNTVCRNCCRTTSNFAEMIMERRKLNSLPSSDRWDLSSIFGPSTLPSTIFTLDKLNNVSSTIPNMDSLGYIENSVMKSFDRKSGWKFILMPFTAENGFFESRDTLLRLFEIASISRHAIVEPCIINATVVPCSVINSIPLFQIYDKDKLLLQYPGIKIIDWKFYQKLRDKHDIQPAMCYVRPVIHNGIMHRIVDKINVMKSLKILYNVSNVYSDSKSYQECVMEHSRESILLFDMNAMNSLQNNIDIINSHNYFDYSPEYYNIAKTFKDIHNISSKYLVFHWQPKVIKERRQKGTAKPVNCLNSLLESMVRWHDVSKSVLQKPILVSGIHVMQGRKRDRITGSNSGGFIWSERDKSIMHSHMHLLETSTVFVNTHKRYKDRVFILILEAIISVQSTWFITCNNDANELCNECCQTNSAFAINVVEHRNALGLQSHHEW